ncbi:MAG: AIPR family protein [Boseongicola sp.]|nr:AIPR family protein [Boseongicola sp.]
MADGELHEAYRQFEDELLFEAEFTGDPQHMCFFKLFSEVASDNGDTADLEYTPVLREGKGGYQVDGYAIDLDRGELFLAICAFNTESTLQSLHASAMESLFRRVDSFCEKAVDPEFVRELEETSPAFEAAYPIHKNRQKIRRIRVILLTNAVLAVRRKVVEAGTTIGLPVAYNVLDFARYTDILKSRGSVEPIEIDATAINGTPLPCLQAHVHGAGYKSYLVVLPGTFLADIYGLYGARLLEQNVRVFLQARTKVNRGIIDTVRASPDMFFAYNNGLTATASNIVMERLPDGTLGIRSFTNLQIVNGGQTTASVLYAKDQSRADLSDVFVQMKLSVIEPERVEEIVPKISRYANTQNRISEADFFSSHPFHVEMEKISRRLSAPPRPGALAPTKWFYERARGQYKDASAYGTDGERRRFVAEYPRNQVVNKTDLAKYATTFECVPHLVSRGAQKCFLKFAEDVSKTWEKSQDQFNEGYFRLAMAKAIVFRETDRLVTRSKWYQADRGYKANIVTYAIAWLVNHLEVDRRQAIDLQAIWSRQELPEELKEVLLDVARHVADAIKDTPESARNVGEYAKQQLCWAKISRLKISVGSHLETATIDLEEVRLQEKDHVATGRMDRQISFETDLVALQPRIAEIREFARSKRKLSPRASSALDKVERLKLPLTRAETNALRHLFKALAEKGMDFRGQ